MKNNFLLRIAMPVFITIFFISCSKDGSLVNDKNAAGNKTSESLQQKSIMNGSLSGVLSPAPVTAKVHAYLGDGAYSVTVADATGAFRLEQLQEGVYTILIEYISSAPGNSEDTIRYMKMQGIRVSSNADTNLGTITVN